MNVPTFIDMGDDEISIQEGLSTMVDVVDELITQGPLSINEGVTLQQDEDVTLILQQKDADRSVCVMINELISAMQNPVKINITIEKKSIGTQAGFSCFPCDLSFLTSAGLFKHDRVKHCIFPFRCAHCNLGYITLPGLTKHLASRHSIIVKQITNKK